MKKPLLVILPALILCFSCLPASAAAATPASAWARDEVGRAVKLGFVPESFQSDYQKDITRGEFVIIAMEFLTMQYNYDGLFTPVDFCEAVPSINAKYKGNAFVDVPDYDLYVNWACALGVISGRGDGTFDPGGYITRQEAARVLQNTFSVYGGDVAHGERAADFSGAFSDEASIASWAQDSVLSMWEWGVMRGYGNGLFRPLDHCTREQCIVGFLRLYENAPVSRALGNITPLVSYEDEIQRILNGWYGYPFNSGYEYTTGECTILYGSRGSPHGSSTELWLVYFSGGRRGIALPRDSFWSAAPIEDIRLSEDESKLYYTVTFTSRAVYQMGGEVVLHEKGVYHYEVDLSTAKMTVTVDTDGIRTQ